MVERYPAVNRGKILSTLLLPDLDRGEPIAQPEGKGKGFWAGGGSSLKDNEENVWLIYRLRTPEKRGHQLCIASSQDGIHFQTVKKLNKEEFGSVDSLERASLVQDPHTGKYRLYPSLEKKGKWYVCKLEDVDFPEQFDPATAKPVLAPSHQEKDARKVKDPYIVDFCNSWHMFYSGSGDGPEEETFLATSQDGETWLRRGRVLPRSHWHNYHTRMSCLIPRGKGFVFLYEGSSFSWYQPHFNLKVGFGYTANMKDFFDLTTEDPALSCQTRGNFHTIRYLDWVTLDEKVIFYYEAARDDDAFELRVTEGKKIEI